MNFCEDYEDNLHINRPKAFLTFSEVDNEFLSANNFIVLNLDNMEDAIPENAYNIESENCEQLQDAIPDKEDCNFQVNTRPVCSRRRKTREPPKDSASKTFPCDLCDEQFMHLRDVKFHKASTHILSKLYKCQECFKGFNFETNFMLHLATHTTAPAKCPQCGTIFQRISSFIGHVETHMDDDTFKCEDCDMQFEFEEYYERHMQRAHKDGGVIASNRVKKRKKGIAINKNTGKYLCRVCGKRFPKPSLLLRHEVAHSKSKPFECLECHQRFSQKSSLDRHSLIHNGIKPFDCPKCTLRFTQRTNLVTHINRVHPTEKDAKNQFQCEKCSCVFRKLKSLNRHITLVHSKEVGENLYINELLEQIKSLQTDYPKDGELPNSVLPLHELMTAKTKAANLPDKIISQQIDKFLPKILEGNFRFNKQHIINNFGLESNVESKETENLPTESSETMAPQEGKTHKVNYLNLVDKFCPDKDLANQLVKEIHIEGIKWLECLYCSKRFQKTFDMLRHIRVHTRAKPYECEICGRNFALKHTLDRHMRIHKRNGSEITKLYQCGVCQERFSSIRSMDLHVWNHNDYSPHCCSICSKRFRSANSLKKHQQTHEPKVAEEEALKSLLLPPISEDFSEKPTEDEGRSYQCSRCGLKFKRAYHLKKHEDSHLGLKIFQCLTCQRKFSSKNSLQNHQKIHFGCRTKECDECHATFFTNSDLKRHKVKHSETRNVTCPYCPKTFKMKDTCKQHITTHIKDILKENPEPFENEEIPEDVNPSLHNYESSPIPHNYILILDEPNSGNLDVDGLNLTLQQPDDLLFVDMPESGIVEGNGSNFTNMIEPATVPQSDMKYHSEFISIEDLPNTKNHLTKNIIVVSHEKGDDSFESFPSSPIKDTNSPIQEFLFQEARANISGNEKQNLPKKKPPHICDICKKIFQKPIDLRRHIRTHTKEKPFQCDICSKAFSLKCTMEDHKLIHSKDRPTFTCQVCGKKYATKNVLNTHLRLHTGERPYKCEICSRAFRTSGHRIAHRRIHSKEKMEAARKKKK